MALTLTGNGTITGLAEGGLENAKIIDADIKDDTISEAKLDIHAAPSGTDKFLGYTSNGMEWTTVPAGGVTHAASWRITSGFTGNSDPITANWEEVDTGAYSTLGSGVTESSGVFSFPATGYWLIHFHIKTQHNGETRYTQMALETTTNNSSYTDVAYATTSQQYEAGNSASQSGSGSYIIDCTNTSNVKFRFEVSASDSSTTTTGDSNANWTYFTALRLADT